MHIIIHGVEESLGEDPKQLKYDQKYVENVIMKPLAQDQNKLKGLEYLL